MKYSISYHNPLTHLIDISMEVPDILGDHLSLRLPSWRPGRYEIANFAQHIIHLSAHDEAGTPLLIEKSSKENWLIKTPESRYVNIKYSYYAHQMDAGNSWLDEEQLYINFINCMLYVEDRMEEPCLVDLHLPDDYTIACGLNEKTRHSLWAESY